MKPHHPITRILCALLLLALLSLDTALAQVPNGGGGGGGSELPSCLPDCFDSPWGPSQKTVVTLSNGCQATVTWRKRKACGIFDDVLIDEVVVSGSCWWAARSWFASNVLSDATIALMQANPMGFSPLHPGDPCSDNWRVVVGACWRRSTQPFFPVPYVPETTWFYACHGSGCCLSRYRICISETGERTFAFIPTPYPPPSCTDPNPDCEPVCSPNGIIR